MSVNSGLDPTPPRNACRPIHSWVVSAILCLIMAPLPVDAQPNINGYFLYLGDWPHRGTPSWGDDDGATNGVGHDDHNWYFSKVGVGDHLFRTWRIWRIPVSEDINQDLSSNPGVTVLEMEDPSVSELASMHYDHVGDLDVICWKGVNYLLAPMTGDPPSPIIAFFEPEHLQLVNYAWLVGQENVGWCATGRDGRIYSSKDDADSVFGYDIDWSKVLSGSSHTGLARSDSASHALPYRLYSMQGGEFSPDGELLYLTCGIIKCLGFGEIHPEDGMHVIRTSDWEEVRRASNTRRGDAPSAFEYNFDNDGCGGDEPEGLTIWDLDDGRAPNVRGQLHVVLMDHAKVLTERVSMKHYGYKVHVDALTGISPIWESPLTSPLPGTPGGAEIRGPEGELQSGRPFRAFSDAVNWYPIWDGAEIVVSGGGYPGSVVLNKRCRVVATGGAARIGSHGRSSDLGEDVLQRAVKK